MLRVYWELISRPEHNRRVIAAQTLFNQPACILQVQDRANGVIDAATAADAIGCRQVRSQFA